MCVCGEKCPAIQGVSGKQAGLIGAWLSLARALGSGPRGRQFKSVRPDHYQLMKKQVHVYYTGRVQGVGFRFTTQDLARDLRIAGWVRNLRDGRVELIAEAGEDALKDFLSRIYQYFSSYIQDADINWQEAVSELEDFQIRF